MGVRVIKYDLLTTKGMTKIRKTLDLLIKDGLIKPELTLKETYLKYLDPMKINFDRPEIWDLIAKNEVIDLFQFDTVQGIKTLKQIKPHSMIQVAQANSLVRLSKQEDAEESPVETYVKFKENPSLAYDEMNKWKVPKKDQEIIANVLKQYNFVADTQESIMALVRVPEITNFNVAQSHKLRKSIAKKDNKIFEEVKQMFYEKGKELNTDKNTLDYIWEVQIKRQKGYSFSILHCIAYTYIALQELVLYNDYPYVYWNTACLTVNASADEEDNSNKSTNYGKVAKAIGQIQETETKVALPNINTANFEFTPDNNNNEIVFGLKGICGLGDEIVHQIILNRPYNSIGDVLNKTEVKKTGLIKLIKAGSFDAIYPNLKRNKIMEEGINTLAKLDCEFKDSLEYGNWRTAISMGIVPENMKIYETYYEFNKYIMDKNFFHSKLKRRKFHFVDDYASQFFKDYYQTLMQEDIDYFYDNEKEVIAFATSSFDKIFKKQMEVVRNWLSKDSTVKLYNDKLYESYLNDNWDKYCKGNLATWSMDSLSYYPEEHELKYINKSKYSIENYFELPEIPTIIGQFQKGGRSWDKYRLSRICGTVLDKDRNKSMIALLTPEGVVDVKFYKGSFMHYDKRISKIENDKKKILENSWFTRGTCLMISGIRQGDQFIAKKYYDSIYQHTVCLIESILPNGECVLKFERENGDDN